jgi:hypothetical protein
LAKVALGAKLIFLKFRLFEMKNCAMLLKKKWMGSMMMDGKFRHSIRNINTPAFTTCRKLYLSMYRMNANNWQHFCLI